MNDNGAKPLMFEATCDTTERLSSTTERLILHDIQQVNEYFIQIPDATGVSRLSGVKKIIIALRILQYGVPADIVDEYIRIGETAAIATLNFFTKMIVAIYKGIHLRSPNEVDVTRLLQEREQRGFPGMLEFRLYPLAL
ncbi:uncharacterized protein LOC114270248 [Camellia sinensis]|uniref:uncharacterized protein LOC114270248 n=1 Tax=Camellia sinensis TaxID=4442 RepID=UPI00103661D6|nr:uncharacterized protein LOC114270248 [Camellia sinensis]